MSFHTDNRNMGVLGALGKKDSTDSDLYLSFFLIKSRVLFVIHEFTIRLWEQKKSLFPELRISIIAGTKKISLKILNEWSILTDDRMERLIVSWNPIEVFKSNDYCWVVLLTSGIMFQNLPSNDMICNKTTFHVCPNPRI